MFNELLNKLKAKVIPAWKGLDVTKRAILLGSAGALVLLIIIMSSMAMKTEYRVLYRDLDLTEAGQIIDHLAEQKIEYKLSEGGSAVMVPEDQLYNIRMDLASAGLPKSGIVGYEIFDQTNLGMTEFLQKVNFRRALEGELAKTISQLEEIKSARVHLVIPEQRLFKEDKKETTASIVVYLNRNMPLSERQIEGIIYLVASSVEGLTTDNITLLDSSGKLLSERRTKDSLAALSSSQLDMQKNVEAYLEDKAQTMLDGVLGQSKSIVRVSVELNFDQAERTIEAYDPEMTAVRSEEISEEKGSETNAKDVAAKQESSNSKKNTIRNYEVNKTIEHLIDQVGNVKRLNVSVSLDGTYDFVKDTDGKSVRQYVPRTQEELDKIIAMVKGSVGFSEDRKDILEIANIPFETVQDDWEEEQRIKREEQVNYWINIGVRAIIALALVFLLWKMRKKYVQWQDRRSAHKRFLDAQTEIQRKAAEIIPKVSKEPRLIDHVRQIAEDNPEEIAKAIKTMMVE